MTHTYPMSVTNDRDLPPDYQGNVFIWDIDKTYLATHFSSLKGLAKIPIEFAIDKQAIAGMDAVLRGLRRGPGKTFAACPLYFVSSSPPQLRAVIARKMLIDGVQPDGFTFKNWVLTLKQLRPRRLKDHLGYKLCALLYGRQSRPLAREFLFGDDVERDAEAYTLYASILAGEVKPDTLESALITGRVSKEDQRIIAELIEALPRPAGTVGGVFIHLARGSDPADFDFYGPLVTPVRNSCQLALVLYQRDLVDTNTVIQATRTIRAALGPNQLPFEQLLEDAIRRRLVTDKTLEELGL